MRLRIPRRFLLYCKQGDALHLFRAKGDNVECLVDGRQYHGANMCIWYSFDETEISPPQWLVIDKGY